ncbi:MAG: hypothetical protein PHY47_01035 [Lachnospiraceae bacterium]|nr:hypothetical protein [Lachnospiraceae bacterium]
MKRENYTSPQQWIAENLKEPSQETKSAVILLWRDMQRMIDHWKLKSENFEKSFKRRSEDLAILKKRMKL